MCACVFHLAFCNSLFFSNSSVQNMNNYTCSVSVIQCHSMGMDGVLVSSKKIERERGKKCEREFIKTENKMRRWHFVCVFSQIHFIFIVIVILFGISLSRFCIQNWSHCCCVFLSFYLFMSPAIRPGQIHSPNAGNDEEMKFVDTWWRRQYVVFTHTHTHAHSSLLHITSVNPYIYCDGITWLQRMGSHCECIILFGNVCMHVPFSSLICRLPFFRLVF